MTKIEDRNTRYYIDIDMKTKKIIGWNFDNRFDLATKPLGEDIIRIFITKGQYNKLPQE